MSHLNEKCGVFGVYGQGLDVGRLTFFGLFQLQHRGQESSGIAVSDGQRIASHKAMGLVTHVYNEEIIESLSGYMGIGHNRYSTSKTSTIDHAQPIIMGDGLFAFVHNGNLPSTQALEDFLGEKKVQTGGCSDSTLMAKAVQYYYLENHSLEQAVQKAFPLFTGAFCVLAMDKHSLVAVRDQYGIRPLALAKLNGGYVISSETCGFNAMGAEFIREIKPGEMIVIDDKGLHSTQLAEPNQKFDIFEFVYFARPDSHILGKSVNEVRQNFGRRLAREFPVKADYVIPVPETGIPVAIGYSLESGIPFEMALVKNRYIHRTFIQPEQHMRESGVKMKLTPLPEILRGKKVIIIDDSIVRGTTSRGLVKAIFEAGAAEVHFLVSSPPVMYPDFYGIDTPKQTELIGFNKSVKDIAQFLGATSMHYLSYEGMIEATGLPESMFNTSCFTGVYPIDIGERAKEVQKPKHAVRR
jgi:amidophosphoribosyltransferase